MDQFNGADHAYFDSATSFAMIRGGKIAMRSWRDGSGRERRSGELDDPGKLVKGMGGAMDLVAVWAAWWW